MKRSAIFYLNRFLYTFLLSEFIFLFIFYLLLLISFDKPLTPYAAIELNWKYPALFLIPIFLTVIFLLVYFFIKREIENIEKINKQLFQYEEKSEKLYEYIQDLREGKTDFEVSALYHRDRLFTALSNLRDEIKKSREEEQARKKEDQQRQWVSEGLAKFGAILRENVGDLQKLTEEVTKNLTKYLDAKQATFFLIKEENGKKYLEMTAFFAYDRKKFPDKRFEWGEGLIGAVAIEKKTVFLKETSENFLEITSGLGGANPRSILIVPVKDSDDNIHGVIELASFKVFEDYQINFVEQVAESTGMTIANIKINLRTQQLLKESQQQAEQLAKQEEILRKSIAELEELQKKSAQESQKFISFLESVSSTFIKAEFSTDGEILDVNNLFIDLFEFINDLEAKGMHYSQLLNIQNIDWFNDVWNNIIQNAEPFIDRLQFISRKDKIIWLHLALAPVKDENTVTSILLLAFDITEEQKKETQLTQYLNSVDKQFIRAEFDIEGKLLWMNSNLQKIIDKQTQNVNIFELFNFDNPDEFRIQWNAIINGKTIQRKLKIVNTATKLFVLDVYFSAIYIFEELPDKILLLGYNDTKNYELQKNIQQLNNQLNATEERLKSLQDNFKKQLDEKTKELQQENFKLEELNEDVSKALDFLGYVVIILREKRIYYVNSIAERIWNVKKKVMLGRRITFLFPDAEDLLKEDNYLLNLITKQIYDKQIASFLVNKKLEKIFGSAKIKQLDENKLLIIFLPATNE